MVGTVVFDLMELLVEDEFETTESLLLMASLAVIFCPLKFKLEQMGKYDGMNLKDKHCCFKGVKDVQVI